MWSGQKDAHQPASLFADANNNLHLIYPAYSIGVVKHLVFANQGGAYQSFTPYELDTLKWNGRNFYQGVAYDPSSDRAYLCSTEWDSAAFRCGMYFGGAWNSPYVVGGYSGGGYLYPNVYATGAEFWVAADVQLVTDSNAHRVWSSVLKRGNFGETQIGAATIGYNGRTYFENDIASDKKGGVYLLANGATNSTHPNDFVIFKVDATGVLRGTADVPGIAGYQNLFITSGGTIHVIGGGQHAWTTDGGTTWQQATYYRPAFPLSEYNYGVAHTMKEQSGSQLKSGSILFLQEIQKKSDGSRGILEIEIENPA